MVRNRSKDNEDELLKKAEEILEKRRVLHKLPFLLVTGTSTGQKLKGDPAVLEATRDLIQNDPEKKLESAWAAAREALMGEDIADPTNHDSPPELPAPLAVMNRQEIATILTPMITQDYNSVREDGRQSRAVIKYGDLRFKSDNWPEELIKFEDMVHPSKLSRAHYTGPLELIDLLRQILMQYLINKFGIDPQDLAVNPNFTEEMMQKRVKCQRVNLVYRENINEAAEPIAEHEGNDVQLQGFGELEDVVVADVEEAVVAGEGEAALDLVYVDELNNSFNEEDREDAGEDSDDVNNGRYVRPLAPYSSTSSDSPELSSRAQSSSPDLPSPEPARVPLQPPPERAVAITPILHLPAPIPPPRVVRQAARNHQAVACRPNRMTQEEINAANNRRREERQQKRPRNYLSDSDDDAQQEAINLVRNVPAGGRRRICRLCRQDGHDRRTCPMRQT